MLLGSASATVQSDHYSYSTAQGHLTSFFAYQSKNLVDSQYPSSPALRTCSRRRCAQWPSTCGHPSSAITGSPPALTVYW